MSSLPEETLHPESLRRWSRLGDALGGTLTFRPRGLLAAEYSLVGRGGEELGLLRMEGLRGAVFEAGEISASIEATGEPGHRYRMVEGGSSILVTGPAGDGVEEVHCLGRRYEVRSCLLRNRAVARASGGDAGSGEVRVRGGLASRGYEVAVPREEGAPALPVAVFLVYRTAALRRRVYLAGRT
jgi:hypothetical protein